MVASLTLEPIQQVKDYIRKTWLTLERSNLHIFQATNDPKIPTHLQKNKVIYISAKENFNEVNKKLQQLLLPEEFSQLTIKRISSKAFLNKEHGLLYLPHAYVVPGGRFNEMYGWDSFFIVLGLLRDNYIELAKGMVDNAVYQVIHYGKILNSNRSYHLDRSHPPLLTQMILAVYRKTQDKNWLLSTLEAIQYFYKFWTTSPHLIKDVGLSRYYASESTPAPEVIYSELDDIGRNHYERVKEYYKTYKVQVYNVVRFYERKQDALKATFYRGDRSVRESGFDPTSRFGPLGADIARYTPVCLNTLLYQMELDMAEIYQILSDNSANQEWQKIAEKRAKLINHLCWDQDLGHYFDYHIIRQRVRPYICATTFYPLWAGIASSEQARRVVQNLSALESAGGLLTSAYFTGNQWDAPFGWAPLHYFAVKGLARYGHHKAAQRLATKFVRLINREFKEHGVIFEKYDVSRRSAYVKKALKFGYQTNEIGFGWTNAVYLELLDYL